MLPEVIVLEERTPPGFNDPELASRLGEAWTEAFGVESIVNEPAAGMGGEDFAFYTIPPPGTERLLARRGHDGGRFRAREGRWPADPEPSLPLFRITPESLITAGVESTVVTHRTRLDGAAELACAPHPQAPGAPGGRWKRHSVACSKACARAKTGISPRAGPLI